jgi:hypothetical protein
VTWSVALERLLDARAASPRPERDRWAVIGSVASALQGCALHPRDVDLLVALPDDVARWAAFMAPFDGSPEGHADDADTWLSTTDSPVHSGPDGYGFMWHFARTYIAGCKVEVAHLAPPEGFPTSSDGAGIWEAGPEIWPHVKLVAFGGRQVPVVPLEIQLETAMARDLPERVQAILSVLRVHGHDADLLRRSLRAHHREAIEAALGSRPDGE